MDHNDISVKISFNTMGYTGDEVKCLFEETTFPVDYNVEITYRWEPSALPNFTTEICLIFSFLLGGFVNGFMNEFGKDFYIWVKNCLLKALKKDANGNSLEEFILSFEDITVYVYDNDIERIAYRLLEIIELIKNNNQDCKIINIKYSLLEDKYIIVD